LLNIIWDQAEAIMNRAAGRGMSRRSADPVRYVGLDEKSFLKGHRYVTVMIDIEGGRVLDIQEGRTEEACNELWLKLAPAQREAVEAVTMDMWLAYQNATKNHVPQASIVHDKFHICGHLNKAVDKVRRKEHQDLQAQGDQTLKGTKYMWLKDEKNMNPEERKTFKTLKSEALLSAKVWGIKVLFSAIWNEKSEEGMRKYFKEWYAWAVRCRLKPIVGVARMLKGHLDNIVTYAQHPITNAVSEGFNAKIQSLVTNARGFRNKNNYRTRILFFCGNLDLYPQKSHTKV